MIDEIVAGQKERGRGFVIVNHPNRNPDFDYCLLAKLREWRGFLGLEIFNGSVAWLDGIPYATGKWDILLLEGRRVWGFANDDSHRHTNVELGWNVAYVKERNRAGVVEALGNGRFYASSGVRITAIRVEGSRIRVETENAQRVAAIRNAGKRVKMADGPSLEVEVPSQAKYVRFECWGEGEKMAWTQPFFMADEPR